MFYNHDIIIFKSHYSYDSDDGPTEPFLQPASGTSFENEVTTSVELFSSQPASEMHDSIVDVNTPQELEANDWMVS